MMKMSEVCIVQGGVAAAVGGAEGLSGHLLRDRGGGHHRARGRRGGGRHPREGEEVHTLVWQRRQNRGDPWLQ